MVFGTFDWFHPGHESLLTQATELGCVIVIIARDANVQKIKGTLPDHSENDRMQVIQKFLPSARVVLGNANDFLHPLRTYKPTHILLGYDQRLPPGVQESDLGCIVQRAAGHHPELYKSSLERKK